MCDKELLIGYLYGELPASEREAFDRHVASCDHCRSELDGLRGTRAELASWAPPEPDLGFEIVRTTRVGAAPARWWRPTPAWGLAAAALLVVAAAAAVANLDVHVGRDGFSIRTGWSRPANVVAQSGVVSPASAADVQRIDARIADLEGRLAAVQTAPAVVTTAARSEPGRMSDAEMLKLVRQLIADAEQRQQGVLARQILQVNRDVQTARQADYDRLVYGLQKVQGAATETSVRQKAIEDHLVRVGLQR
jgi:hypothetical protein